MHELTHQRGQDRDNTTANTLEDMSGLTIKFTV